MPMCNGAGEMPGREGNGSYDDGYEGWVDSHEQEILEAYQESYSIVPLHYNLFYNFTQTFLG